MIEIQLNPPHIISFIHTISKLTVKCRVLELSAIIYIRFSYGSDRWWSGRDVTTIIERRENKMLFDLTLWPRHPSFCFDWCTVFA